jgi:hypothetical protein
MIPRLAIPRLVVARFAIPGTAVLIQRDTSICILPVISDRSLVRASDLP